MPKVVLLSSTELSKMDMNALISYFLNLYGVVVDVKGFFSGLALLWDKSVV